MKVVYNNCFGGFGLSEAGYARYKEIKGVEAVSYHRDIPRDCPALINVIEEMGCLANGHCAKLAIKEIPDRVEFEIDEYDGNESVVPPRMSW